MEDYKEDAERKKEKERKRTRESERERERERESERMRERGREDEKKSEREREERRKKERKTKRKKNERREERKEERWAESKRGKGKREDPAVRGGFDEHNKKGKMRLCGPRRVSAPKGWTHVGAQDCFRGAAQMRTLTHNSEAWKVRGAYPSG
jgi:hypothetical protein